MSEKYKRFCECEEWQKAEAMPTYLLDELHTLLKSYPDTCPYCKESLKKRLRTIYVNVATTPEVGVEPFISNDFYITLEEFIELLEERK